MSATHAMQVDGEVAGSTRQLRVTGSQGTRWCAFRQ
jgi:hypothetical protein